MYVDSHHYLSYLVYRMAGLGADDARVAAYANQQVDDNNYRVALPLTNGTTFNGRFSLLPISAEREVFENLNARDVWDTWFMFHFIAPCNQNDATLNLVTTPTIDDNRNILNPTADKLMQFAVAQRAQPHGRHLFGAAGHMLLDTFSHQQWIGIKHDFNYPTTKDLVPHYAAANGTPALTDGQVTESAALYEAGLSIGHVVAMDLPDRPTAEFAWAHPEQYVPAGYAAAVTRSNTQQWLNAVNSLYFYSRQFVGGTGEYLSPSQLAVFQKILSLCRGQFNTDDYAARCNFWMQFIRTGTYTADDGTHCTDAVIDHTGSPVPCDAAYPEYVGMQWYVNALNAAQSTRTIACPDHGYYNDSYNDSDIDISGLKFDQTALSNSDFFLFQAGISAIYDWMAGYYRQFGVLRPS